MIEKYTVKSYLDGEEIKAEVEGVGEEDKIYKSAIYLEVKKHQKQLMDRFPTLKSLEEKIEVEF